jgi:predicted  nucleic acid-binding Zn-ribbon protein
MSTTQIAATLYQLQQIDLELERISNEQQAVATSLQGDTMLQKLRAENKRAEQQLQVALQAQRGAELALEDVSQRLKAQEQRLYSGIVKNPKELKALQQEIQHLRMQQELQEEKTLEAMDATESWQEMVQTKSAELLRTEEAWTSQSAAMLARRDQLESRQQEVQAKREQLTARLDASLVNHYDKIRRTRQGRAVSKVEQSSCQWCRVILTASQLQHVRTSTQLQTCSNCGRILYYDR